MVEENQTMNKINTIIIHHAGSIGSNNYVSSLHITPDHIDKYHKSLWNFPSEYMRNAKHYNDIGEPYYAGYNVIYDPKDRSFTQCRAIGEETAHTKGKNLDSFGLCIIGNYNRTQIGAPDGTVDPMTDQIKKDISTFLFELIDDNWRDLIVAEDVKLDFAKNRIYSHRFFSNTMCYGTGIGDNFFRDEVLKIKDISASQTEIIIEEQTELIQILLRMIASLVEQLSKMKAQKLYLGSVDDREDPENLPEEVLNYKL